MNYGLNCVVTEGMVSYPVSVDPHCDPLIRQTARGSITRESQT